MRFKKVDSLTQLGLVILTRSFLSNAHLALSHNVACFRFTWTLSIFHIRSSPRRPADQSDEIFGRLDLVGRRIMMTRLLHGITVLA
jgi:hypothetical protein